MIIPFQIHLGSLSYNLLCINKSSFVCIYDKIVAQTMVSGRQSIPHNKTRSKISELSFSRYVFSSISEIFKIVLRFLSMENMMFYLEVGL